MVAISVIVIGCGSETASSSDKNDSVSERFNSEFETFLDTYNKHSGIDSYNIKQLYESNRNTQYAYVSDMLRQIDSKADENIVELNKLKESTPAELMSLPNVSQRIEYSIEIAQYQKNIA